MDSHDVFQVLVGNLPLFFHGLLEATPKFPAQAIMMDIVKFSRPKVGALHKWLLALGPLGGESSL
eukprot:1560762-Amphidinium_carterae.1